MISARWESLAQSSVFMKETLFMICRGHSGVHTDKSGEFHEDEQCIVCKRRRVCLKVRIPDVYGEEVFVGSTCLSRLKSARRLYMAWSKVMKRCNSCDHLPQNAAELASLRDLARQVTNEFNGALTAVDASLGMDKSYIKHPVRGWGYV